MINGHDGGRRPGFLGRWSGYAIVALCFGSMVLYALHHWSGSA